MNALLFAWIRLHKWRLLLVGIVALLLVSPFSDIYKQQDNIITPLTAIFLLGVIFGTARHKWALRSLSALTFLWLGIGIATEGSGLFADESLIAPILFSVLLVIVFCLLARWMTEAAHVDSEVICAAICGYLLLGIFWMGLYAIVKTVNGILHPGGPTVFFSATSPQVSFGDLLYFSYTTLTTTGYGDIIPRAPVVRMLAVLEALTGLFYNTIVIARLVGLYGIKRSANAGSPDKIA